MVERDEKPRGPALAIEQVRFPEPHSVPFSSPGRQPAPWPARHDLFGSPPALPAPVRRNHSIQHQDRATSTAGTTLSSRMTGRASGDAIRSTRKNLGTQPARRRQLSRHDARPAPRPPRSHLLVSERARYDALSRHGARACHDRERRRSWLDTGSCIQFRIDDLRAAGLRLPPTALSSTTPSAVHLDLRQHVDPARNHLVDLGGNPYARIASTTSGLPRRPPAPRQPQPTPPPPAPRPQQCPDLDSPLVDAPLRSQDRETWRPRTATNGKTGEVRRSCLAKTPCNDLRNERCQRQPSERRRPVETRPRKGALQHRARQALDARSGLRPISYNAIESAERPRVQLRGPERSEGHVSCNVAVRQRSPDLFDTYCSIFSVV